AGKRAIAGPAPRIRSSFRDPVPPGSPFVGSLISDPAIPAKLTPADDADLADSFEAAVMAGDDAAGECLERRERPCSDPVNDGLSQDDEPTPREETDAPWLPVLGADDRRLVFEYML